MNIQELADRAQLSKMPADSHCREPYWTATDDELQCFAALVLEEAAKVCDEEAMDERDDHSMRRLEACAREIRALKGAKE